MDAHESQTGHEPSPEIMRLLRRYADVLELARVLPRLVWLRRRDTRFGRLVRVPRLRWLLRYFLVLHMHRMVQELRRRSHARAALHGQSVGRADLEALESFERSLPPSPPKKVLLFLLLVSVFLTSFSIASAVGNRTLPKETKLVAEPLGSLTAGMLTLDRRELFRGIKSFGCRDVGSEKPDCTARRAAASTVTALMLIASSVWLLLLVPLTSFKLKRVVLNAEPATPGDVRGSFAAEEADAARGTYALERGAFELLGGARPREVPFDLLVQATLMIVPLLLGAIALRSVIASLVSELGYGLEAFVVESYILGLYFCALVIGGGIARLVCLRRRWTRRQAAAHADRPVVPAAARRAIAQAIDGSLVLIAGTAFVWLAVRRYVSDPFLFALVPAALPLVGVLYTWLFSLQNRQTLGRRALGLELRRRDGGAPRLRLIAAREGLKWIPVGCAVVAAHSA
ncbi:MAG: RDD family protein, partial [Gaiellaceae bacterium]